MNGIKFAERIKELRLSKNMTMEELGNKLNKTKSTISTWEKGTRSPKMGELEDIAKFFNVSVGYLLGLNEVEPRQILENVDAQLDVLLNKAQKKLEEDPDNIEIKRFLKDLQEKKDNTLFALRFEKILNENVLFEYGKSTNEILFVNDDDESDNVAKILKTLPKLSLENLAKLSEYSEMLIMMQNNEEDKQR
ncbi:helix-turn-helix transcriptional regulator [Lactococcus lactis]|uniref:helix-turn-helix domain-containing protein n=1 Tax=Lactococcus sp. AK05 TaxID=3239197 RepID=UPI002890E83A|nr:helix-turn-helix transcriptional regulator [Lactococcus lactis]MDT2871426.1 helix-turn-helix transcriptional regulator [Lactococcus lactis]MDT2874013.1 helix-turn-helix transcriptional regulator [Lactococcus lactis]MDT2890498.1 helix-turn-helix transcriptional regulator [Lactococcus lactis]MDT2893070.1 helix-turn-helix transcriptional regulator [Lactococcus lactis]MDT2895902.1 helix-turn-helix transcriptional regulator [Lactococcus lactis]